MGWKKNPLYRTHRLDTDLSLPQRLSFTFIQPLPITLLALAVDVGPEVLLGPDPWSRILFLECY